MSPSPRSRERITEEKDLLLITDDPALARSWIEQTRGALGNKPLLVVCSAQAAPLLLPYSQSGQINGMLGGLAGGALYEKATQRTLGQATTAWAAYQTGIFSMLLLMVAGGVYQAIKKSTSQGKHKRA